MWFIVCRFSSVATCLMGVSRDPVSIQVHGVREEVSLYCRGRAGCAEWLPRLWRGGCGHRSRGRGDGFAVLVQVQCRQREDTAIGRGCSMMKDQSDWENDLFPIASPAWMAWKATRRRIAKQEHARRLRAEGANLKDRGAKWT